MRKKTILHGACALAVLTMASTIVAKEKMSAANKHWLEQEVAALITADEIELFTGLESEEERATFKRIFWARRDPTPDTPANELKADYENRRRVANSKFKEKGRAGSATEMGRVFLLLGSPLELGLGGTSEMGLAPEEARDAAGGATVGTMVGADVDPQRETPREGIFGEMFPEKETSIQTWVYPPNEALGIPDGLTVRFRAQLGFGYRLVGSKELDQALEVVKSQNIVNPSIAYERDEQGRLQEPALAMEEGAFRPTNPVLIRLRETRDVESNLPFRFSAEFFRSSGDLIFIPMVFDIDEGAFGWAEGRANVAIAGLIEDGGGNAVTEFDETTVFTKRASETAVFEIPLYLTPGRYTIYLGVLDTDAMTLGTKIQSLEVPALSCKNLETSSVLLFSDGKRVEETVATPGRAFVIGGYHFVPKLDTIYRRTEQLSGVFQACGYGLNEGRPHLTAQYLLLRDGVKKGQTKDEFFMSVNEEMAITVFDIPLSSFESGSYALRIQVSDHVKGKMLTKEVQFELR